MASRITAVIGAQWGDEGKGKLVDILGASHSVIVRSAGGANAGHTIVRDGKKFVFHLLPSGMLTDGNIGVIGNGCVVHFPSLMAEIEGLESLGVSIKDRVFISDRAHLLFDFHRSVDALQEERKGKNNIGTTKRGIGPCYADKISRSGIRAIDAKDSTYLRKKLESAKERVLAEWGINIDIDEEMKSYQSASDFLDHSIIDTALWLNDQQKKGVNILLEGAQAFMLDIDFGTYPFVTSSSISIGGVASGSGINPRAITEVIGVLKAYCTRVGSGPFPSELSGEIEETLRKTGGEFGATTGRPRRCGWIDIVALRTFVHVNAPDAWNVTKLDVLDDFEEVGMVVGYKYNNQVISSLPADSEILSEVVPIVEYFPGWKCCISNAKTWDELPHNAQQFLKAIEEKTGVFIKYIGVGAGSEATIVR